MLTTEKKTKKVDVAQRRVDALTAKAAQLAEETQAVAAELRLAQLELEYRQTAPVSDDPITVLGIVDPPVIPAPVGVTPDA